MPWPRELLASLALLAWRLGATACVLLSRASALLLLSLRSWSGCQSQPRVMSACLLRGHARLEAQGQWLGLLQLANSTSPSLRSAHERRLLSLVALHSVAAAVGDAVLGLLAFALLQTSSLESVAGALLRVHHWVYRDALVSLVNWLMGVPADFKLNGEFTSFIGGVFLSMFSLWETCTASVFSPPVVLVLLRSCQCCSLCGVSLALSLLLDAVSLGSLPLLVAYAGMACCWKMFLSSVYTLLLLFQCKKHNILRSRVDHHNFSLDQVLMGALLLCISVFLFPSVFMYYAGFAAAWLALVAAHGVAASAVSCVDSLPWLLLTWLLPSPHAVVVPLQPTQPSTQPQPSTQLDTSSPGASPGASPPVASPGTAPGTALRKDPRCGPWASCRAAASAQLAPTVSEPRLQVWSSLVWGDVVSLRQHAAEGVLQPLQSSGLGCTSEELLLASHRWQDVLKSVWRSEHDDALPATRCSSSHQSS
mmetsp:Transcript_31731/g.73641  ORF Transcript_31731/g.73641 Transcript_31731/m.73641 type:complete len:478 (+) Transcript_31731:78-1511(+)